MEIPLPSPNLVDILLVVDDSPAIASRREQVRAHIDGLVDVLGTLAGGMPDVHIGVVSTDVGTVDGAGVAHASIGTLGQGGCAGAGKSGNLQTNGASLTGAFLSDRPLDGARVKNYTGDLTTALEKMVDLGSGGCAYARPFEAAKRALGTTAANAGFLRADAYLYVIYLSAGDDCSFAETSFLDGASTTDTSRCQTNGGVIAAADFAASSKALKADPGRVLITAITGAATPPRFHALAAEFPNRATEGTLDAASPSDALVLLAQLVKIPLGDTCWESPLADLDPVAPGLQPECTAQLHTTTDDFPMKRCAPGLTDLCYEIVEDQQSCPDTDLRVKLDHTDNYRALGNTAIIECLVEASP